MNRQVLYERYRSRLSPYLEAPSSFDEKRVSEYTAENGWRIDDYEQPLPPEPPGLPLARGSFAAAREILTNYTFPPPGLITGIFQPDTPLAQRVMLLRGRFLVFTFWFGVRIGGVVDEVRPLAAGGQEAVWGYNYRTLQGHFERGQIDFSVHKQLETGHITFKIHAVSQTGHIANPFYRLGFRLFGRTLQRRFARESLRRVRAQVEEMLAQGTTIPTGDAPAVVERTEVPEETAQKVEQAQSPQAEKGTPPAPVSVQNKPPER